MIRAVDAATIRVYERHAAEWEARRTPGRPADARAFGARVGAGAVRVDVGCGPGSHTGLLGRPVLAVDAARAMVRRAAARVPGAWCVQADLACLPVRRGALGGAWARASYLHVPRTGLPMALHELHRALEVGAPAELTLLRGAYEGHALPGDDFPGRFFAGWEPGPLADVVTGAGFDAPEVSADGEWLIVRTRRARTLADTVAPVMRLLVVGLNPSLYAADAGVGFARPGNRFWPAALAAGVVSADRDPVRALAVDGVGMTDLVKRATPSAAELGPDEHRAGLARVERLASWLSPGAVCVVGLAGWRQAVARGARPGVQPRRLGGRPVYLMPNTSGLNARVPVAAFAGHLRAAAALADAFTP